MKREIMTRTKEQKEKTGAYDKVYYQKNKQKKQAYGKVYQQENREKISAQEKVYYQKNKEKKAAYNKVYNQKNREKIAAHIKVYQQENKEKIAATKKVYQQERYKNDPDFKISQNVRRRLRLALKGNSKAAPTMEIIGCTIEELWLHLESKFEPGMTRENHGRFGWHIDHKKPCCAFDLSDLEQQKICFHYSNLQPLWAKDNLEKGGNYNEE